MYTHVHTHLRSLFWLLGFVILFSLVFVFWFWCLFGVCVCVTRIIYTNTGTEVASLYDRAAINGVTAGGSTSQLCTHWQPACQTLLKKQAAECQGGCSKPETFCVPRRGQEQSFACGLRTLLVSPGDRVT